MERLFFWASRAILKNLRNHNDLQYLLHLTLFTFVLTSCASSVPTVVPAAGESRTLTVFAAASLTDSFTEIGKNFEDAHPGVTVYFNFAGSQALRTQIEEGAPADVFASASGKEMDTLVTDAFVSEGGSQIFLNNKLVVILPAGNPAGLDSLEDLANTGVKIVLAAEEVPRWQLCTSGIGFDERFIRRRF